MSISKMCPRCHSKYKYGGQCPNGCYEKAKKLSTEVYDQHQRKNKKFYNSTGWLKARSACISRDGMCLWTYYKNNLITPGKVVHHIIEVDEDKSKALNVGNLIYLSAQAHNYIHKLYKVDKDAIQRELLEIVEKHKNMR